MQMKHPTHQVAKDGGRRPLVLAPPSLALSNLRSTMPVASSRGSARRDGVVMRFREGGQEQPPGVMDRLRHIGESIAGKVPVMFQLNRRCNYGEAWGVCGSCEELGGWDTSKAVVLKWSPDDKWFEVLHLPQDHQLEFKYVLLDANRNNAFKAWANDASNDANLKLHVTTGNKLAVGNTGAQVQCLGEGQATSTTAVTETTTTTTTTTTPAGPTTPSEPLHAAFAERVQATVQPLVSGVSVETTHMTPSGATLSSTTPLTPVTSTAAHLPSNTHAPTITSTRDVHISDMPGTTTTTPAGGPIYTSGTTPDVDRADPANQMVMTPDQLRDASVARHIQGDSLTTDMELAGGPVEPAQLAHLDPSSLHYRAPHPPPSPTGLPTIDLGSRTPAPTPSPLTSHLPGPTPTTTWLPGTGASPMAGSPISGPTTTTTGATLPDIGPFTMGTSRGPTYGDMGAHDASLVAASGGADVFAAREASLAAEAARHTLTQEGGMEMPISGEAATAASILSQLAGPDEELPMAPLQSGITPMDGIHAAAGGNVLNPKSNPLVMAANIVIQPAKSLFGKVMGHGSSSSPSVAARSTIGYGTTPEEREMPLETAAAQTNMPAGFSGAGEGQAPTEESDWYRHPESGTERDEKPYQREPTPTNISEGEEAERRAYETSKGWMGTHPW